MKADFKTLLDKVKRQETDRGPVSMYLDKNLYKDFQKLCGDVPASKILEQFMREALGSTDPKKKP